VTQLFEPGAGAVTVRTWASKLSIKSYTQTVDRFVVTFISSLKRHHVIDFVQQTGLSNANTSENCVILFKLFPEIRVGNVFI